jgi:hypothetical protein
MTPNDKRDLDDLEKGGYLPRKVKVKINGEHVPAFTHVPNDTSGTKPPPTAYLDIMIQGASENEMGDLVQELTRMRAV